MQDLINYKIVMDYAVQEVKKLEGSKISNPKRYEKAVYNLKNVKKEFIRAMNKFCYEAFVIGTNFDEEN